VDKKNGENAGQRKPKRGWAKPPRHIQSKDHAKKQITKHGDDGQLLHGKVQRKKVQIPLNRETKGD
jgi:hypothetical protein